MYMLWVTYVLVKISCARARTFTVANNCPYTVWPAIFTGASPNNASPDYPTGWENEPHTTVSFTVPDDWTAGRIWGRRDCDFSNSSSGQTCLSAWCIGGLECNPTTGTGVPPATVAEWTLQGNDNKDYYDVSLVDGFNLPMQITNAVGCPVAGCTVDLDAICPSALKGPANSSDAVLGCQSACDANLSGDQTNSPNCCTGSHDTKATCPSTDVEYYSFFKGNCPNSYAYAYDESSGTALWTCDSSLNAEYVVTFCPSTDETTTSSSAGASESATGTRLSSAANTVMSASVTPTSTAGGSSDSGTSSSGTNSAGPHLFMPGPLVVMSVVVVFIALV